MIALITAAVETLYEVIKRQPNYDQKKREQFYKLRLELNDELKMPDYKKNDGRIDDLYDELRLFFDSFRQEIKSQGISREDI